MRKNIFWLSLLLIAFATTWLTAQQPFCGMGHADLQEVTQQMLENRETAKNNPIPDVAVTYVPVRFHLVADNDGEGRASEALAFAGLCNLNAAYEDQDIQFYIKEFKYLNHNSIFTNPMSAGASFGIANQMTYNALNVFIVEDAGGGAAAYYQPPAGPNGADWIVCGKSYLSDVRVLAHEVGHFFSLPHPFNGWEPDPYDEAKHGNPVTQFFAPDGSTPVEHVDGGNCNNAGDYICDTPADYMFPSGNCSYNLSVKDKNGDLLAPMLNNHMNYHFGCGSYVFTGGQKVEVSNSLFSFNRNYVRPNYTPNTEVISDDVELVSPNVGQKIDTYNAVPFSWTAVDGADNYLLEISNNDLTLRLTVSSNSIVVENKLEPNSTYLWKVTPFNELYTCAATTPTRIMKTGDAETSTIEIDAVSDWTVVPNPVKNGNSVLLSIDSNEAFDADISIVSLTGQVVQVLHGHRFLAGRSNVEITLNELPAGVYSVFVKSDKGVLNQRLAVTN